MPNTTSAKKALRGSLKKRNYNLVKKFAIRTALKNFRQNIVEDTSKASELLANVYSSLDRAVKTNFIPKRRADRKKSRIAKALAKASLGK